INVAAFDNTASQNGTGFEFRTGNGTLNIAFDDNTASSNTSTDEGGVLMSADGGELNVASFTGNTLAGNVGSGAIFAATDNVAGGTINVRGVEGNTVTNNGTGNSTTVADGIRLFASGATAVVDAEIGVDGGAANTISGNGAGTQGGAGIGVRTENSGTI